MNELDPFEAELERLRPAKPPEALLARLAASLPDRSRAAAETATRSPGWHGIFRWLIPSTALALITVFITWRFGVAPTQDQGHSPGPTAEPALKADHVEIAQRLVAAFDAVGRLPDGQPVRFHCREWSDEVVLRNSARGITIEHRTPRLEVIPVSLETY